jgi:hypothetical protein
LPLPEPVEGLVDPAGMTHKLLPLSFEHRAGTLRYGIHGRCASRRGWRALSQRRTQWVASALRASGCMGHSAIAL